MNEFAAGKRERSSLSLSLSRPLINGWSVGYYRYNECETGGKEKKGYRAAPAYFTARSWFVLSALDIFAKLWRGLFVFRAIANEWRKGF